MKRHRTGFRVSFPAALIVAALAAGCAPSFHYEPMVRQPVPTIFDEAQPPEKGTIVVKRGDTLYALARQHGVALRGLIDTNRLVPPYTLQPGQRLRLPQPDFHIVEEGETVYAIAQRYGVDMGSLVRVNEIPPPYRIERGQRLRLPEGGASGASPAMVASAEPEIAAVVTEPIEPKPVMFPAPQPKADLPAVPVPRWSRPDPGPLKDPPPRSGQKFLWPVNGKVIVSFGARKGGLHNDGINIAATKGTAIRAAENGVVAYAGNQLPGFGNLVLIRHDDGWMSAYAHASILLVRRGDVVQRGQVIAKVGRTGSVSEPQLHFELRRGDRAVDPRHYLVRVAEGKGEKRVSSAASRDGRRDPG